MAAERPPPSRGHAFLAREEWANRGPRATYRAGWQAQRMKVSRRAAAPPGLGINELFDQSKLVTASIAGVLREGAIAAGLTGLMILLFLGWEIDGATFAAEPLLRCRPAEVDGDRRGIRSGLVVVANGVHSQR